MRRPFALLALLALACSDPVAPTAKSVTATTDRTAYARPDTVIVTVVNDSDSPLSFPHCGTLIQRRGDDVWEEVTFPNDLEPCPAYEQLMPARTTWRPRYELPAYLSPGEYRFAASAAPVFLVSNTFTIE